MAKPDIKLYSTDLVTRFIIESNTQYTFEHCNCQIKDVLCKSCSNKVGYHVVAPCQQCLNGNNNN